MLPLAPAAPRRRALLRALALLLAVAAFAAMAAARVVTAGESELARSTQALQEKDPDGAILHARRAASWALPRAPHVRKARERLRAIAVDAEAKKRPELALFAWRALRSSEIEARSWSSARTEGRDEAERAIARLAAAAERPVADRTLPSDAVELWHAEALVRDTLPSRPWVVVAVVAAVAWLGGAAATGRRLGALSTAKGLSTLGGLALLLAAGATAWVLALLRA